MKSVQHGVFGLQLSILYTEASKWKIDVEPQKHIR